MNYPQAQLPFSTTVLQHNRPNFRTTNPPYTPQLAVQTELVQYAALLAGETAMELQNKATQNGLRTYLFNRYAANNYTNEAFAWLVNEAAKYANYLVYTAQAVQTWEEACSKAAEATCTFVAAFHYFQDPGLAQVLQFPPDMNQMLASTFETYQKLQNQYARSGPPPVQQPVQQPYPQQPVMQQYPQQQPYPYPQQGMMPMQPMQQPMQQMPMGYPQPGMMPMPGQVMPFQVPPGYGVPGQPMPYPQQGMMMQPGYPQMPQNPAVNPLSGSMLMGGDQPYNPNMTVQPNMSPVGTGRVYSRGGGDASQSNNGVIDAVTMSPQGFVAQPFQTREPIPEPTMQAQQPQAQNQIVYKDYDGSEPWYPTPDQPYFPTWNLQREKLVYAISPDGQVKLAVIEKTREEIMKFEEHRTVMPSIQRMESIQRAVVNGPAKVEAKSVKNEQTGEDEETLTIPEYAHIYEDRQATEKSVASLFFEHDRAMLALRERTDDGPDVFTTIGTEAVLINEQTDGEGQNLIDRVAAAQTLSEAASLLHGVVTSVDPVECKKTALKLNKMLGDAVDERIQFGLSIHGVKVGNFAKNFDQLSEMLREHYGELTLTAFLRDQREFIARLIRVYAPTVRTEFIKGLILDEDEAREADDKEDPELVSDGFVGLLYRRHSITTIAASDVDLNIGLEDDYAGTVLRRPQPYLYDIIQNVLKRAGDETANNYLITEEGTLYLITKGLFGDDFYQIRVVK